MEFRLMGHLFFFSISRFITAQLQSQCIVPCVEELHRMVGCPDDFPKDKK